MIDISDIEAIGKEYESLTPEERAGADKFIKIYQDILDDTNFVLSEYEELLSRCRTVLKEGMAGKEKTMNYDNWVEESVTLLNTLEAMDLHGS